ncbi:MAG: hypothetical protein H6728_16630 [Myxococcales bacterium]|nr:hypothetical protein [Myxococcales bacterium]
MYRVFLLLFWLFACVLAGCPATPAPSPQLPDGALLKGQWALVVGRSEQSGVLSAIDLEKNQAFPKIAPISNDAVGRMWGDAVYIINRYTHDNIQVMDAKDLHLIAQYSVGTGANPQDLVVVGQKAYISCLGLSSLLVVEPKTGKEIKKIDMSILAEVGDKSCQSEADCEGMRCLEQRCALDNLPELGRMYLHEGRWLFVLVQRLDQQRGFLPVTHGMLAVIDTQTDTLVKSIPMQGKNPLYLTPSLNKKELLVAQVGEWMDTMGAPALDGLLERFSLDGRESLGVAMTESELRGNMGSFMMYQDQRGFMIRTETSFRTALVRFSLDEKKVDEPLVVSECTGGVSCFSFVQVAKSPRGEMVLLDRYEKSPGLRVFRLDDGTELTSSPLDTGLPPDFMFFSP